MNIHLYSGPWSHPGVQMHAKPIIGRHSLDLKSRKLAAVEKLQQPSLSLSMNASSFNSLVAPVLIVQISRPLWHRQRQVKRQTNAKKITNTNTSANTETNTAPILQISRPWWQHRGLIVWAISHERWKIAEASIELSNNEVLREISLTQDMSWLSSTWSQWRSVFSFSPKNHLSAGCSNWLVIHYFFCLQ